MLDYKASGGQARFPLPEGPDKIHYLPMPPITRPEPRLAETKVAGKWAEEGWFIDGMQHQHFLPGVTPEMIDWFWANMEKCYYLWAPGSHKYFQWVREPWKYGFVNSAHVISENKLEFDHPFGMEPDGLYLRRFDMKDFPLDHALTHVLMEGPVNDATGEIMSNNIHMWEATEGGTNHITVSVTNPKYMRPGMSKEEFIKMRCTMPATGWHEDYECLNWPVFLPAMYNLWKNHPDPCQNVQADLSVREIAPGQWVYNNENGPVEW